ncbi:MAG: ATP-dependent protease ATPase subunit HslU [Planctomycetales bacterium]
MEEKTPRQIVEELDQHIIGQQDAKRAVAIAIRNRWRWRQLPPELRKEILPKNIIMIGPTGVGKTEITRRLAKLTGAPFVKVEATKYTEVGYHGRDVESMIRDLVEAALNIIRQTKRQQVEKTAVEKAEERILELLIPSAPAWDGEDPAAFDKSAERHERTKNKMRELLRKGDLEDKTVQMQVEQRHVPVQILSNMGMEQMDIDFQSMFEKIIPRQSKDRQLTVREARQILIDEEVEALMDKESIQEEAVQLAQDTGIIFIDELDKICGPEGSGHSIDVSRQGVQRDLLPVVEGTTVQTRYGQVRTEHILFIAAGAFHRSKPSDLMPELQGRFPIRVELQDLSRDDFLRILTEPSSSMTKQYQALLGTEGIKIKFTDDGLKTIAKIAYDLNQSTQNIGARRLHTILERLLDDISYEGPDLKKKTVSIDSKYVNTKLAAILKNEDLAKFIL